jgi:hypothetical protein
MLSAQQLALITNVVLVFVTDVYAFLTSKIMRANQRVVDVMSSQLDATTRPYIAIDVFSEGSPVIKLRIRNLGTSAAKRLRLKIDRSFYRFQHADERHDLQKAAAFNKIIETFPPQAELLFDLGIAQRIFANSELTPHAFKIVADYGWLSQEVSETTHIDLGLFHQSAANPRPIAAELQGIQRILEKMLEQKQEPIL